MKQPGDKPKSAGLECPKCGCRHLPVVYTRPCGKMVQRRRSCRHCGHRFATFEVGDADANLGTLMRRG